MADTREMSGVELLGVGVRYLTDAGQLVETTAGAMDVARVLAGQPVRRIRSHRNQKHYPGWYWSFRTGKSVPYESRLERSRLQLADFDPDTIAIAAQPLQFAGDDGVGVVHHVPDFLIARASRRPLLVDVKPAEFAHMERAVRVFQWTSRVCAANGLDYQVWTGEHDRVRLRGIQAVAVARRRPLAEPAVLDRMTARATESTTIGELERVDGIERQDTMRAAWEGIVDLDFSAPLSTATKVTTLKER